MKALVLYETKHGFTERIAQQVAGGLREAGVEAEVRSVSALMDDDFRGKDLWVFGCPTHFGRVPFGLKAAVKGALKEERSHIKAAVFDTRMKDFPEGASVRLKNMLEAKKVPVLGHESFVVETIRGPLVEGEEAKAHAFGADIGRLLAVK